MKTVFINIYQKLATGEIDTSENFDSFETAEIMAEASNPKQWNFIATIEVELETTN